MSLVRTEAGGECISAVANPFALLVIADLLGVPEQDHAELTDMLTGEPALGSPDEDTVMAHTPLDYLYARFTDYIEERRRSPRGDVIELHRGGAAVREPIKGDFRLARTATTVGGVEIPAGTTLMAHYGAANRDGRIFDDPNTFDPDRANARHHMGFGRGVHSCIGAPLARAEGRVLTQRLLERTAGIEIDATVRCPCRGRVAVPLDFEANSMTVENFNYGIDVNMLGCYYCNLFAAQCMEKNDGDTTGSIVNLSSIASVKNETGLNIGIMPYALGKCGLNYITELTAVQYAAAGVRANTLMLGPIDSVTGNQHSQSLFGLAPSEVEDAYEDVVKLKMGRGSV